MTLKTMKTLMMIWTTIVKRKMNQLLKNKSQTNLAENNKIRDRNHNSKIKSLKGRSPNFTKTNSKMIGLKEDTKMVHLMGNLSKSEEENLLNNEAENPSNKEETLSNKEEEENLFNREEESPSVESIDLGII